MFCFAFSSCYLHSRHQQIQNVSTIWAFLPIFFEPTIHGKLVPFNKMVETMLENRYQLHFSKAQPKNVHRNPTVYRCFSLSS